MSAQTVAGVTRVPAVLSREAELQHFCAEFYPRLARYCYRLVHDEELARDLTQEAFARLLARRITVRDPEPYLFFIAANLVRDLHRRARRRGSTLSIEGEAERDNQDRRYDVHLAVELLPRSYRRLVLLRYFADMSVAEVAAAVRCPVGTVKRQLSEARALLAADLAE